MKRTFSILAATFAMLTAAAAEDFRATCARGGDERVIEVISPGEVGAQCDVRYVRDGGANVRTPYHANNSAAFCLEKANELMRELEAAGFSCSTAAGGAAPTLRPAAEPAPPPSDFVIETQRDPSPAEEPPAPPVEDDETAALDGAAEETDLAARMNEILAQPAVQRADEPVAELASQGPANLTDQIEEAALSAPPPSAPLGPIIGAEPEETPAAEPDLSAPTQPTATMATQTALAQTEPATAPVETAQAPASPASAAPEAVPATAETATASAPVSEPPVQAAAPAPVQASAPERKVTPTLLRKPEDIVRATVRAQAAAWNEGDLDAFMDIYWKNDALKFVSGGDVTRGWSATMKRYRDRYQGAAGMGRIDLDKLEAQLVTEDVAVVTGRVRHAVGENASASVFSLVMRRDEGVWRIVHDHTGVDPTALR